MTPRGQFRLHKWEECGRRPMRPMTYCYRGDLPNASWIGGDYYGVLEHHLRNIDRNFVIIYDRCTAPNDMSPAHHLYRIVRRGGVPHDDFMVLEFSLQEDMRMVWPNGKPLAPGNWLLETVKKYDKARLPGDEAAADKQVADTREEEYRQMQAAYDKQHHDAIKFFEDETDPYVNRGRAFQTNPHHRKDPKARKAVSYNK